MSLLSVAGLRLCDHAEVGLRQVPGGRGPGRGAAGGLVGGCRTGPLLAARPLIQRRHHTGTAKEKMHTLTVLNRLNI